MKGGNVMPDELTNNKLYSNKLYSNTKLAVVPGYYLVCYNEARQIHGCAHAVVPGYYLVCYNHKSAGTQLGLL